uniref:Uncharacterized protein n=2 Tax=viral metagenome TaxID=1070528 RepID=A0A6M3JD01_9ZZZZ
MSRIQCKGCDYQPSSFDTIEGYCMGCAAQIIKAHEALLDENVRLKREHDIVLEDNQRIRENSKAGPAEKAINANRICSICRGSISKDEFVIISVVHAACYRKKGEAEPEKEQVAQVKHPTGSNDKPNHKRNYCFHCGVTVKNQKYCHGCGRKLLWPATDLVVGVDYMIKAEPEPRRFTKHARHFIPPKTIFDNIKLYESSEQPGYLEKLLHEACDRIDAKDETIDRLTAENAAKDAEICRLIAANQRLEGFEGSILEPLQERYKIVCEENVTLHVEIDSLTANQFPESPICSRCGKPRKSLGVLWDNHIDCKEDE